MAFSGVSVNGRHGFQVAREWPWQASAACGMRHTLFWYKRNRSVAHARLHIGAEAMLRADRVAEVTGNGPRTAKLLPRLRRGARRSEPSHLWWSLMVEKPFTRGV